MTVRAALVAGTGAPAPLLLLSPSAPTSKAAGTPAPQITALPRQDVVMAAEGCGADRWAVKTASDADRYAVSTTQHQTTIDNLRRLAAPASLPSNRRIRPTELTEYVIGGTLTGYRQEGDGDIHLIISNSAGRTVVAEIPDTHCVVATRFKTEIANARRIFLARYTPSSTMRNPRRAIRVRGIGFFDYPRGGPGAAPNGIELHPVLGLGFP